MSSGYRVRLASFARDGGVFFPSGGAFAAAGRRLGRPLRPPPVYRPPPERCWTFTTLDRAEAFARELRAGSTNIAVAIEPIEPPAPGPRPKQMSFDWNEM
jgi:hypothetical protein